MSGDVACPICGQVSTRVVSASKAYCTNPACDIYLFNPHLPDSGSEDGARRDD